MPLKFVFGPSGSGKSTYLYQHVIEESEKNPQENFIVNQRVYLGWLVFVIMLIGILYGLYNAKARALAVLAAVGAVLTVLHTISSAGRAPVS